MQNVEFQRVELVDVEGGPEASGGWGRVYGGW